MKWVDQKKATKDGKYLTYSINGKLGILIRDNGLWYAITREGRTKISDEQMATISDVCKIVPPKRILL